MKKLLTFCLLLFYVAVHSQELVTLKFSRPTNALGATEKIQLTIQNNDYLIKDGGSISLNVTPDNTKSIEIVCSLPSGIQTNYYLDPKPSQTYEFEVGIRVKGLYILLKSGEEASLVEPTQQPVEQVTESKNKAFKVDRGNQQEAYQEPATAKERWQKKSGNNVYLSLMLSGIYAKPETPKFGKMNAAGAGYSYGVNGIKIKMPEYQVGKTKWNSFNWGLGFDFSVTGYEFNTVLKSGGVTNTTNHSNFSLNLMPFINLGWTWSTGKYVDENSWKGIAFTLKYRPTYNFSYINSTITKSSSNPTIKETKTTTDSNDKQLNFAGIGFDIDFIKLSCIGKKISPRPRGKISVVVLAPINDNPLFVSVNFGLAIFSKKKN